jgi:hypothetical protein
LVQDGAFDGRRVVGAWIFFDLTARPCPRCQLVIILHQFMGRISWLES